MLPLLLPGDLTMLELMRYLFEATIPPLRWIQVAGSARLLDQFLSLVLSCTLPPWRLLGEGSGLIEAYLDEITDERWATVR